MLVTPTVTIHLLSHPKTDGDSRGIVDIPSVLKVLREEQGVDGHVWLQVIVVSGPGSGTTGYLRRERTQEWVFPAPHTAEIDRERFAIAATVAARDLGVNRDLLIAIALIKTDIRNVSVEIPEGNALGPFLFAKKEWMPLALLYPQLIRLNDPDTPQNQLNAAAAMMADHVKDLEASLGRLATANELYLAHLIGAGAAVTVIKALKANGQQPIGDPLREFHRAAGNEAQAGAVLERNAGLFHVGADERSVEAVMEAMAAQLSEAIPRVAEIVALLPEEERHTTGRELSRVGMIFPMRQRPKEDYHTDGRQFGADRPNGRAHAACDLIALKGTEVLAMADGTVIRGPYPFYSGTDALEVRHDDGKVVRYGEIDHILPSGVEVGARVARGQVIARVGQLESKRSMLHLEMYRGTENGSLTQAGNKYKRRADLMDPTPVLDAAPLLSELSEAPVAVGDAEVTDRWVTALRLVETSGASAATAAPDSHPAGIEASRKMAENDLPRVVAIAGRFVDVAGKFGVPAAVLAALASRESRCGGPGILTNGWGDNGNAFGIMQIDKHSHDPIEGKTDPASLEHIEQAAGIFSKCLEQVMQNHLRWADQHLLKGAAVAYNSGPDDVQSIAEMDKGTTGEDYGSDVMARAQYYLDHRELSVFRS